LGSPVLPLVMVNINAASSVNSPLSPFLMRST
jgi:hypothetical protein